MKLVKRYLFWGMLGLLSPFYLLTVFFVSFLLGMRRNGGQQKPRIVWGPIPIINNVYWSRAMRDIGYTSETYTTEYYQTIHERHDWDRLINEKYSYIPLAELRFLIAFVESLFKYDVYVIPFTGYFLGLTPLWIFEAYFFRISGKKTILLSYGADSYVYRNVRSVSTMHALMISYPKASKKQEKIFKKVSYWCRQGDVIIAGMQGVDGFGRWDVLVPNKLHIDLKKWDSSSRCSTADGTTETVFIAHAPNHRGFKGSEFIIQTVKQLQAEGIKVELILIEKQQNRDVKRMLQEKVDILVEQVICTGHGMNALEGMASALPTISNLEDENCTLPFRRWSFLNECPIVSASPETLTNVLRKLIAKPDLRRQLGEAGRKYVEKYHGLDSAQYLFAEAIDYMYGRRDSLINLYHPILGDYNNRKPKIEHPLVNNHIVD